MSRTTTAEHNDSKMLKKMVARTHPDIGGDHELYIYAAALRERLLSGELAPVDTEKPCRNCRVQHREEHRNPRQGTSANDSDRIPYLARDFKQVTREAARYASENSNVYADVLSLLSDCYQMQTESMQVEQERGASYKRLAAIGHLAGMSKSQRVRWYRVAESIPLSDRHAGHLLSRLKRRRS